jgi:hypothetical protein
MQDPAQKTFQGDNFVRRAGDFDSFQALNLHSVAAMNRGQDISMMVRPLRSAKICRSLVLGCDMKQYVFKSACPTSHSAFGSNLTMPTPAPAVSAIAGGGIVQELQDEEGETAGMRHTCQCEIL